ncbi:uncharacterized protein NFIA_029960 [Aspergillus fischeri NRRL 181]|uniref:Uncharacterized protein n=1 Tax=Neosartorya fischeri (strain ATCC 1020 / DSM 3700 / CBS 544.65 / FGSC A1164 / JCM 1740 / NRRL 181 / WB 181) TaxID=331117 RepID=A1D9T3_NEOFI|nr:uncharacterized protein NFIA_029960 [Aspergillus fischeri NRRL 181]EAW20564.1 hypothetical protein NFIA_029960 [Aspergillus fischeri NRRL 181]KAG2025238.1 hypothetical protein GB937_002999 [Aspergillus fischeri]
MDLLQKHGHLKHDRRKSTARKEETEQRHQQTQQQFNELLGNFGQSHNDHPDRRSSGAGNMARDIEEFQRRLSNGESLEKRE